MSAEQRLLSAIEEQPSSIREGADSLALLYAWKRGGGDGPGFGAAIQSLHDDGLIEILPGPDMRLRLTGEGFSRLDALIPEEASELAPALDSDQSAWRGVLAATPEMPMTVVTETLLGVYRMLGATAGRPVSADTLLKIWTMDSKRGGDLRTALDTLAAAGELTIERGARTTFALTDKGAAHAAALP